MMAQIPAGERLLSAIVLMPSNPVGLVVFGHAAGSSLTARVDAGLARSLYGSRFGTLRCELVADREMTQGGGASDLPLLVRRLLRVTAWLGRAPRYKDLPMGFVGWHLGAIAALLAAPLYGPQVKTTIALDGSVELGDRDLAQVATPVLLAVTGPDARILSANYSALGKFGGVQELAVVAVQGPLLEAPRALAHLDWLVTGWLKRYLVADANAGARPMALGNAAPPG